MLTKPWRITAKFWSSYHRLYHRVPIMQWSRLVTTIEGLIKGPSYSFHSGATDPLNLINLETICRSRLNCYNPSLSANWTSPLGQLLQPLMGSMALWCSSLKSNSACIRIIYWAIISCESVPARDWPLLQNQDHRSRIKCYSSEFSQQEY